MARPVFASEGEPSRLVRARTRASKFLRIGLPWPQAVVALWVAVLLVGGNRAAKMGLHGPLYPNEVLFAGALLAVVVRRNARRPQASALRHARFASTAAVLLGIFAFAFVVAAARGANAYGRGIVTDAGLGYVLLIPATVFLFGGRRRWLDECLRVFFWASVVAVPVVVLEFTNGSTIAPLSLSVGFVFLFSLAPMFDDWLHGRLSWIGKLYVIGVPVFVIWEIRSRSALVSLVVGLVLVLLLSLRGSRRWLIAGAAVLAVLVTAASIFVIAPGLLEKIPPVKSAESTFSLAPDLKGNNARWRLDFSGALLHRSVRNATDALIGVGLGKPSRFIWRRPELHTADAYDFRGTPIPNGVTPNVNITGPHDGFVDVAYRLGWPAALALIAVIALALYAGIAALREASEPEARSLRTLIAAVVAGIIVTLTSDALRVPEAAVPFAVAIGLLAAYASLVVRRRSAELSPVDGEHGPSDEGRALRTEEDDGRGHFVR